MALVHNRHFHNRHFHQREQVESAAQVVRVNSVHDLQAKGPLGNAGRTPDITLLARTTMER